MKAKIVRDNDGNFYGIRFNCPGCSMSKGNAVHGAVVLPVTWLPSESKESPQVDGRPHWTFNGNFELPTFGPSVLSRWSQYMGDDIPAKQHVCHSFVRDGRIQFLGDCTHALAGQTVDLPEIE